jgi:hypothetical protein
VKLRLILATALLGVAAAPLAASAQAVDVCDLIPRLAIINPDPTAPPRAACRVVFPA